MRILAVLSIWLAGWAVGIGAEVKPATSVPEHTLAHVHYDPNGSFVFVMAARANQIVLPDMFDVSPGHLIFTGPPGNYLVHGIEAGKRFSIQVTIGGQVPVPPPIPDPDPPSPPDPPAPTPSEFRVLILEETADRASLPREQLAALMSVQVRGYLNAKTAKGPDGRTPDWRVWDDDFQDAQIMDHAYFQTAYKRAKEASKGVLPWIYIGDGRVNMPLPKTEAELLNLLKQYGG